MTFVQQGCPETQVVFHAHGHMARLEHRQNTAVRYVCLDGSTWLLCYKGEFKLRAPQSIQSSIQLHTIVPHNCIDLCQFMLMLKRTMYSEVANSKSYTILFYSILYYTILYHTTVLLPEQRYTHECVHQNSYICRPSNL